MSWFYGISLLLAFGVTIMTSKYFYFLNITKTTENLLNKYCTKLEDLDYSFEEIVYFYSLPSHISAINQATKSQFKIKLDYSHFLMTQLNGVYIEIESDHASIMLAYLPVDDFMLPFLDELLNAKKIGPRTSQKVSQAKLIHPDTLNEIVNEVYNQVQFGRYN
ncbi:hypothetical protein SAMN05421734_10682 [Pelagirhabdus alkalitolerans]|uniref:Uncharacterized protein n=1 Tax=Pelagirhabdus alkalitolerans TaxID=1612202 RepID=A0A1G6KFV7_9BACI|nr:hypothetical protein [Pelagirhabdus alkalitolerans]SDC29982.1 hypothetical protein SAMN05421734_10682 [Pelagirhabdus alkalitolerans]